MHKNSLCHGERLSSGLSAEYRVPFLYAFFLPIALSVSLALSLAPCGRAARLLTVVHGFGVFSGVSSDGRSGSGTGAVGRCRLAEGTGTLNAGGSSTILIIR